MQRSRPLDNRKGGFALLVVLFSLLAITALFAITQKRSVGRIQNTAAETMIVANGQIERDLLEVAIAILAASRTTTDATVSLGPLHFELNFRDVATLADLNTAAPNLLQRVADDLGIPATALQKYAAWRSTPRRLRRVADFLRITEADAKVLGKLQSLATVHSGRSAVGLHPTGNSGDPAGLLQNTALSANYQVSLRRSGSSTYANLGVVHIAPDPRQSRVLQLF